MKVVMKVSTNTGAKPGDTVEVTEREGRTLVFTGHATEVEEEERTSSTARTTEQETEQSTTPEADADGDDTTEKEG